MTARAGSGSALVPHTAIAFAALLGLGCVWGATQPLTKVAVSSGHHPFGLIFWQFVIVATVLGAVTLIRGYRIPLTAHALRFYVIIALIGTLIPNSFSYAAAVHLPAGILSLAVATVPMMTLLIALGVGNERFVIRRVIGIALGVTAMMLIALPEASLPEPALAPWLLVALIAPLCYAAEGNYIAADQPKDLHPVPALFAASVIGMIVAAPLALLTGNWLNLLQPWQAPEYALLASSVGHAIAYSGYIWLVAFAGVVFSAQIGYFVTGSAIVFSMMFLGESYSAWVWGAVAMMAAGLFLVQPSRRDR